MPNAKATDEEKLPQLSDLPPVPDGANFQLRKIARVSLPHPYCIGTGHVAHAANHFSGMLTEDAIRDAEKNGITCETCRDERRKGRSTKSVLSYDAHESQVTLFIAIEDNEHLNSDANKPMRDYIYGNKERFTALGIDSFAFPNL